MTERRCPMSKHCFVKWCDGDLLLHCQFFTLALSMMYTGDFIFQKVSRISDGGDMCSHYHIYRSDGSEQYLVHSRILLCLRRVMLWWLTRAHRAIAHDPKRYSNPDIFNPSRFLDESGKLNNDNVEYTFGFGRRWIGFCQLLTFQVSISMIFSIESARDATWHLLRWKQHAGIHYFCA